MPIRRGRGFAPQNTFLETIFQKFDRENSNFVLGSAQEKNNYPIVYCSDGFCELTGFTRSELMRRSCGCSFLYGLETNKEDIISIENALKIQIELKKEIMFYRKNGSPFWCLLDIVPIKNEKGNVVLFLASHKDITKRKISGAGSEQEIGVVGGNKTLTRSRSRKFSRDVLLHLSRQYTQTTSPTSKTNARRPVKRSRSFSFNTERLPQYKRESDKKSKFLFLHYSNTKGFWDWLILILTTYIAIMIPYNVAFRRDDRKRDLIIFDVVIELFFIMDIVVHFRTSFVDKGGRIIYDQKRIAVHYLKGWFILDFLAALPFEALYFINQSWANLAFDRKESTFNEGFLIQLLKCGRLLRLFRVVRKLHRYTEYSAVLLTLLMIAFAMVAHWLACIWYVIGLSEIAEKSTVSWLYALGESINRPYSNFSEGSGPDEGSAYITAFYFTLTSMTTVGFGNVAANTNSEKVFAVITMLIGALMHAAIFGNVAAIIQKLYANRVRYHSRANEIKQFIRVHRIEPDLANRLEDYFHTTWSLSGGVDTSEILTTFPEELQSDVCMHLYKGLLELSPFSQAPRGCLRMLSPQVRTVYIGPGEVLLVQNDVINAIYYIANGSMEVLQGESVAAILGKGDLFGEDISRKTPPKRANGDVRALTYCDVYFITRERLQNVLHFYQEFAFKFSENLELTYDLGAHERDIWRRHALDSISEDEELNENDKNVTEVDGGQNHVNNAHISNHYYGNSVRFKPRRCQPFDMYRKPNHFRVSTPWNGMKNDSQTDWETQVNRVKREIASMLPEDKENDSSLRSSKLSLTRQLAVDVNAELNDIESDTLPEEKSSSEPFSNQSLEWGNEKLTLNGENSTPADDRDVESFEMENLNIETTVLKGIAEESEPDECSKLLRVSTLSGNEFIENQSGLCDSSAFGHKYSTGFSKKLFLTCDQEDLQGPALCFNEDTNSKRVNGKEEHSLGTINNHEDDLMRFVDEVADIRRGLHEDGNRLGYTDFDTMKNAPGISDLDLSPVHSSVRKSPVQGIPSSPIESTRGSSRSGFSELPFRDCIDTDRLKLSGFDSQSGSPDEISDGHTSRISLNEETPTGSSQSSSEFVETETLESPQSKVNRIFDELSSIGSPGGSVKDSRVERRKRNGGLRRTLTEVNYPSDSGSSLNGTPVTTNRRRKVSGVIKPPAIFAPLVANVKNPYKDFVPPVRESAIMCDCESPDHTLGINCNNCWSRESEDIESDSDSICEDRCDNFNNNVEDLIADKQLLCLNDNNGSRKSKDDDYSSKRTLLSENSSKTNESQSDTSQKVDDSPDEKISLKGLTDYFEPPFSSFSSMRKPSISGAYSTQCFESDEIPESDELEHVFRPMRSSFSEPHLSLRLPILPGGNGSIEEGISLCDNDWNSSASEDDTNQNFEEIFKDVCCTKEAIEKLESILKIPEPDVVTDEADTAQTVQGLNQQVLNLNREVASLSSDVKTVLELLKGLKIGQL